jgi:hypothetical protein
MQKEQWRMAWAEIMFRSLSWGGHRFAVTLFSQTTVLIHYQQLPLGVSLKRWKITLLCTLSLGVFKHFKFSLGSSYFPFP